MSAYPSFGAYHTFDDGGIMSLAVLRGSESPKNLNTTGALPDFAYSEEHRPRNCVGNMKKRT
jgi:hypothetical protein